MMENGYNEQNSYEPILLEKLAMKTCFRFCCLLTICICCQAWTAGATTLNEIINELQPIEGNVVETDGQIILNLGTSSGVLKNDLFTVFHSGKKLTDPVTGKDLGNIESRVGLLSVTKVEKDFSYARPAGSLSDVKRGDKVVRFKDVIGVCQDKTSDDGHFIYALQDGLQAIIWQDQKTSDVELIFVREGDMLVVQNQRGRILREYQLGKETVPVASEASSALTPVYAAEVATAPITKPETTTDQTTEKIRYDLQTYGYDQSGNLPFSVIMGDFLMLDGKMHLAVIQEHEVGVYEVSDKGVQNLSKARQPLLKLISVCWWQPSEGSTYIAVTGYDEDEEEVSSVIFSYSKGNIAPVRKQFPYILGSSDSDGDGRPESLLAQNYDQDVFFGRNVAQVKISGDRISTVKYKGDLPTMFRVTGGTFFQPAHANDSVSAYLMSNKLYINSGNQEVYTSGKGMGGSLSSIRYVQNPGDINPLFSNADIEVRPLAVDIDNDSVREILVPGADQSAFSSIGGANAIKKSWVSVVKKTKNGSYMKGKIGGDYEQNIQGLGMANDSLYLLTVSPSGIFSEGSGSSRVLILPLK